jgi:hypothetical protein
VPLANEAFCCDWTVTVSGFGGVVLPDSSGLSVHAKARGERALEFEVRILPEFEFEFELLTVWPLCATTSSFGLESYPEASIRHELSL